MKKTDSKITRYEHRNYYVDIVEYVDGYEAWVMAKNFGVSKFMFGLPKVQIDGSKVTFDLFYELVDINLNDYLEDYRTDVA